MAQKVVFQSGLSNNHETSNRSKAIIYTNTHYSNINSA